MAKSGAIAVRTLAAANRKPNPVGGTNRDTTRITFKKADNGLISETHKDGGDGPYQEPTTTIHPSISHAAAHLKSQFGGKDADKDGK